MSIIMFHYVKEKSNYFHFNLTKFDNFVRENKDRIVSIRDYVAGDNEDKIVLTFDDGTIDHYTNVFPVLKKYGVTGVFSVSDNIITRDILIVQKIHKLMEIVGIEKVYDDLINIYTEQSSETLLDKYETKERVIKKLLQKDLDLAVRLDILDKIVKKNNLELDFDKLYMNLDMVREMQGDGNEFVYHTRNHCWLSTLSYEEQEREISAVKDFVSKYGFINSLTLPFGDYNDDTISIAENLDIDFIIGVSYTNNKKCLVRVDCSTIS